MQAHRHPFWYATQLQNDLRHATGTQISTETHDRYGGSSLMVWGRISFQGKADLHVFWNGTLTAIRYRDEILDPVLGQALQQEWDQIPQQTIRNLICSMRRRCQAVIPARGGHTRY
nr:hypothetical protein BaRGS_002217 [Batillaria attramentaria]